MQKCITSRWFSLQAKITRVIGIVLGVILCLLGIIIVIANDSSRSDAVAGCLLLVMLGIVVCIYCVVVYTIDTRAFRLGADGITVQYAGSYTKQHGWNEISNIVICDVYHSTRSTEIYERVIRFAIGEEPNGPLSKNKQWTLSGHEKWSTYEYGLAHFQTVISISFTPDRLEQVKEFSCMDILDLTKKQIEQ